MGREASARIIVQVQPNARKNTVVRFEDSVWYIRVAAPPVKGKANQALIRFLSEILATSKTNLTIEKGMTSRRKVVMVKGLAQSQITEVLKKASL
jgi:uncharacterized protein (TIGR00251 family)